jgi:hypothetical protein
MRILPILLFLFASLICALVVLFAVNIDKKFSRDSSISSTKGSLRNVQTVNSQSFSKILVVYAYYESDSVSADNLRYFLRHAIGNNDHQDSIDYVFVVNGFEISVEIPQAGNIRVLKRENTCYDSGAISYGLQHSNISSYSYFIFLNKSLRGPFLPLYLPNSFQWTSIYTNMISNDVKWAGSTISCAQNPHVQSSIVVTDQVGLNIALENDIFACQTDLWSTVLKYEVASSAAILKAGFNIASLMHRYKGIDFRNPSFSNCNRRENPTPRFGNDGLDLDPFEVVFIKVKTNGYNYPNHAFALKYMDYSFGRSDINGNDLYSAYSKSKAKSYYQGLASLASSCGAQFDAEFYHDMHSDLHVFGLAQLESHFFNEGFFVGRAHRYKIADPNKTGSIENPEVCSGYIDGMP